MKATLLTYWLVGLISVALAAPHLQWTPLNEPGSGGAITSMAIDPADSQHLLLGGDMLGIGVTRNGGQKWDPTLGLLSYEIANFTFNPQKPSQIWVGTMSGPHVSNDGGLHWESKRKGLPPVSSFSYTAPIQQIFINPQDDQQLLAFGGSWRGWSSPGKPKFGTIWESSDGGKEWFEYGTVAPNSIIRWAAMAAGDFNTFYAVLQDKGIYKGTDRGSTWESISEGLPSQAVNQVVTHPTDPNTLWVTLGNYLPPASNVFLPGGVWKSTDAGKTWKSCNIGLPQLPEANPNYASRFEAIAVSPSQPDVLYTADTSWNAATIYRTEDGGETWKAVYSNQAHGGLVTAYLAPAGATVITIDPHDPNTVYCAGTETLIKSVDGGNSWVDLLSDHAPGPASMNFQGRGFSGLCANAVRFNPDDPNTTALLALDAGRLWLSNDHQQTWHLCLNGFPNQWGGGSDLAFAGPGGKILLGAFGQFNHDGNLGLSMDGGLTWTMLGQPDSGLPRVGQGMATSVYLLHDDWKQMWAVYNHQLYHSTDGGKQWAMLLDGKCNQIVASPKDPTTFYVTGDNGVQKTTDGKTFVPLPDGPKPVTSLVINAQNPDILFATQGYNSGGGLWKYDGRSWTQILKNELISGLAIDPTDGNRLAVSTNRDPFRDVCDATGPWISEDGGRTWSNQADGLPCLRGWNIAINPSDPEQLIFCSQGRGFFVTRWPKSSHQ